MRVLVTGATGFVGGRLVPALVEAGHEVVALTRDASRYDPPEGVVVAQGNVLEYGSFEHALKGVDAAYYLIHSMQAGDEFEERDRRGARNFARAASEAGVERVIYLGGLGEDRNELSKHLRSRREVEYILEEGDYDLTTLRAAIIIGDGSASFDVIRQLGSRLPFMITPKWVRTPCQPIAIDDVIAYLVGVLDVPATAGNTFEIGGPEVFTYQEILAKVTERVLGFRPLIIPVPVLTPKLSAYWIGLVTDVSTSVATPLIHGLKNSVVVNDTRIRTFVPIELTGFDEAVEKALGKREAGRNPAERVELAVPGAGAGP